MPRPRPSILPIREPSPVGGGKLSKLMRRLASRAAEDVFVAVTGVRFHEDPNCACAGLGVMLRNSAKLRLFGVVATPQPAYDGPPPGVDIMDEGRGVVLEGGVEGAGMPCLAVPIRTGVGDVARYMSRVASSSPFLPSRAAPAAVKPRWRRRAERATSGGGVRGALGGEERQDLFSWKELMGRSSSSSSDRIGERGSSGMVEVSETKERLGMWVRPKRACMRWLTGDDSGSL
jgi:hypothetical protein